MATMSSASRPVRLDVYVDRYGDVYGATVASMTAAVRVTATMSGVV